MALTSSLYLIEVQHASDHDRDGRWYELDRVFGAAAAARAARWFRRTQGYAGRSVRMRLIAGEPVAFVPPRPAASWRRAVRRARSAIRFSS